MRLYILPAITALLLQACNNKPVTSAVESHRDTLVIIHRDTVVIVKNEKEDVPVYESQKPEEKKVLPEKQKPLTPKPVTQKEESDTAFSYYVNKRVSVKTTSWVNGERWVLLYNLQGEETYRHKDVRKSWSVIAHLKFHPNGAVSAMNISNNPGASQFWHETIITFSTTNDPLQKTTERKPYEDGPQVNKPWEYWDNKTKQWKKQEVQE